MATASSATIDATAQIATLPQEEQQATAGTAALKKAAGVKKAAKAASKAKNAAEGTENGVVEAHMAAEPAPPAAPAPDTVYVSDPLGEMGKELNAADREIRRLTGLVADLSKSDLANEVAAWSLKFDQLSGRVAQLTRTGSESEKQARSNGEWLSKIHKALGVERVLLRI